MELLDELSGDNGESEIVRTAIEHYAQEQGLVNGSERYSNFQRTAWELGKALGGAGVFGLALTLTYPVSARLPAMAALLASVVLLMIGRYEQ